MTNLKPIEEVVADFKKTNIYQSARVNGYGKKTEDWLRTTLTTRDAEWHQELQKARKDVIHEWNKAELKLDGTTQGALNAIEYFRNYLETDLHQIISKPTYNMTSLPNGKTFTELEETLAPIRDTLEELAPKDERTWEERFDLAWLQAPLDFSFSDKILIKDFVRTLLHTHTAALAEEVVKLRKNEVKWKKTKYDVKSVDAVLYNRGIADAITIIRSTLTPNQTKQ